MEQISPAPAPAVQSPDQVRWSMPRWIAFPWKFLVGVALMQTIPGAIVLMGWIWRVSQRFILKAWWKRNRTVGWEDFLRADQATAMHRAWPNFFVEQECPWSQRLKSPKAWLRALFGSLWLNFKTGAQAAFNTMVITAPAWTLWIFSWYDGWNNSFNKGYEQAAVGPVTGLAGVFLFIAAMFYLPLAQTRHAATGDWRTFYQFRLVWTLIRRRWLECLGLAMVISALSLPLMVLKTAPGMFTAMHVEKSAAVESEFRKMIGGAYEDLTPKEALEKLKAYYFLCGIYLLPAILLMRLAAARIYASSVVDCIQSGVIPQDALHESEWKNLSRLNLLFVRPPPQRNRFIRLITWVGTKAGAATIGFAIFLVYFTLVAQVYVGEFLHKNDRAQGWWNQPLVQLPLFNYVPGRLKAEAQD